MAARLYGDPTYDSLDAHRHLLRRMEMEYDAWAYSLHQPSLYLIQRVLEEDLGLHQLSGDYRVMAWVKPWCSFKPGVGVAYAWEPVIVRGGRRRTRRQDTVRERVAANVTLRRGLAGAKPEQFFYWLFEVLNLRPDDEFHDLFPGTGAATKAWERWRRQARLFVEEAQTG